MNSQHVVADVDAVSTGNLDFDPLKWLLVMVDDSFVVVVDVVNVENFGCIAAGAYVAVEGVAVHDVDSGVDVVCMEDDDCCQRNRRVMFVEV